MKTTDSLTITALRDGGYVVSYGYIANGGYSQQLYASTTVAEALKFISKMLSVRKTTA